MTIDWALLIEWLIKAVLNCLLLLGGFAYMTYAERKVAALLQTRIGPNRVGPLGLLQPLADGIKLIFKEEPTPAGADRFLFFLAPVVTAVPALIILAVVPAGPLVNIDCCQINLPGLNQTVGRYLFTIHGLGIADINVGMLYILSIASIAIYGVVLGGWSSDNKYAMLGGIRSSAQMVSYELAMGLSVIGTLMIAGSMSMNDIVVAQERVWFLLLQPVAAGIFYLCGLAEVNRAPFDMPEAEQELTAGYHTEYSGMKFALFFAGEYIKMIGLSAIFVSLFLGGWQGPFVQQVPLLGPVYFVSKTAASLFFMIWLRSTHPRLRYDRLMALGWKILLPLALANVMVTAAALLDLRLLVAVLAALVLIAAVLFGVRWMRSRARALAMRRA